MRQFVGHGGGDETVHDLLLSVAPPAVRAAAAAVDESTGYRTTSPPASDHR
jgi:hypothetical protein